MKSPGMKDKCEASPKLKRPIQRPLCFSPLVSMANFIFQSLPFEKESRVQYDAMVIFFFRIYFYDLSNPPIDEPRIASHAAGEP